MVKADDFPTQYIQMVFAHMSPLIQSTMRTPTEVSHIVMLTAIPISKFFDTQWLPNSDCVLKTNPGTTAKTNTRATHGTVSTHVHSHGFRVLRCCYLVEENFQTQNCDFFFLGRGV